MTNKPSNTKFFTQIVGLLQSARSEVVRAVNQTMVLTYFEIGKMIVEEEQNGKDRAEYGKYLLKELSKTLTGEFGKGFSVTNIQQMRQFYLVYSIGQTPSDDFKNISQTSSAETENQKQQTLSVKSENQKPQTLSTDSKNTFSETLSRKFNLSWSHYLKLMRVNEQIFSNQQK